MKRGSLHGETRKFAKTPNNIKPWEIKDGWESGLTRQDSGSLAESKRLTSDKTVWPHWRLTQTEKRQTTPRILRPMDVVVIYIILKHMGLGSS